MPNNRTLIEAYMKGGFSTKKIAILFLSKSGSWMFEDGRAS